MGKNLHDFCRLESCLTKPLALVASTNHVNLVGVVCVAFKSPKTAEKSKEPWAWEAIGAIFSLMKEWAAKSKTGTVNSILVLRRGLQSTSDDAGLFAGDVGLFEDVQMKTSCRNLKTLRGQVIKWQLEFSACHGKLKCMGKSSSESLTSAGAEWGVVSGDVILQLGQIGPWKCQKTTA